jgi:hypothetical protein
MHYFSLFIYHSAQFAGIFVVKPNVFAYPNASLAFPDPIQLNYQ